MEASAVSPDSPGAGCCDRATKSWSLRARVYADGGPAGSFAGGPLPGMGVAPGVGERRRGLGARRAGGRQRGRGEHQGQQEGHAEGPGRKSGECAAGGAERDGCRHHGAPLAVRTG